MGLYSGGLIIGRIFASEILGGLFREGLFLGGLIMGILRYVICQVSERLQLIEINDRGLFSLCG